MLLGPCAVLRESRPQEGTILASGKLVCEQVFASGSPSAALLSARPPGAHGLTQTLAWERRLHSLSCLGDV